MYSILFHIQLLENCIPEVERKFIQIVQKNQQREWDFLKGDFSTWQGGPMEVVERYGLGYLLAMQLGKFLNLIR